jgi:hypothetical protein
MSAVDDIIKQWMLEAERSGEMQRNPHLGKPLNLNDGYDDTPEELRMVHKILKNAGYQPHEVHLINRLAALKAAYKAAADEDARLHLRSEITSVQTRLSLLLERYRHARR